MRDGNNVKSVRCLNKAVIGESIVSGLVAKQYRYFRDVSGCIYFLSKWAQGECLSLLL